MTRFGEQFGLGIKDMLPMAVSEAIASVDKGFDRADMEAAWFGELVPTDGFASGILADSCGLLDIPVTRLENACATGNDAIRHGVLGIASGFFDVVLVVGADKVRETSAQTTFWDWMSMTRDMAWDFPLGLVAPANFALHVNRYLYESPATREHMAMVAVKNHHHGVSNPKAQMRFEITIEQVLNAPLVVEPFGLYDCTPQSDGAAAALLVVGGGRRPLHRPPGVDPRCGPRRRPGHAPAQGRHDDVPADGQGGEEGRTRWPGLDPGTSTWPRSTTVSPASS